MQKAVQVIFIFVIIIIIAVTLTSLYFGDIFLAKAGFFASANKGIVWVKFGQSASGSNINRADITSLKYNPKDHRIMYAATLGSGLYKSIDSGATWHQLVDVNKVFSNHSNVYSIAIDNNFPKKEGGQIIPDKFFIATYQDSYGRIFKTEDGGLSFKQVYITSRPKFAVFDVAIDPARPNVVWAATADGLLLKSQDYGEAWKLVQEFGAIISAVLIDPRAPNQIFITTIDKGIFSSSNGGTTWVDETDGLKDFPRATSIQSAYRDPTTNAIYLSTGFGLLKSNDGGISWNAVSVIFADEVLPVTAVGVSPKNRQEIYVAAANNIYRTLNGGESWQVRQINTNKIVRVLLVNPDNPSQVLAGVGKSSLR